MDEITNDNMVYHAILMVCKYLKKAPLDDPDDLFPPERESAALARQLCHELLDASAADGADGCRLCQH